MKDIVFSLKNGHAVINGRQVELPGVTTDTLTVSGGMLICVDDGGPQRNRNAYLVSQDGAVLWQIEDPYPRLGGEYRGYTGLRYTEDGKVLAYCSVGVDFEVDLRTGKVKPWVDPKNPNKRPW